MKLIEISGEQTNRNPFEKSTSVKPRESKLAQKPITTATRIRPRNGVHQTPKNTARRIPSQTPSRLSTAHTHASRVMTPFKTPNHSKALSAPTPYKTPNPLNHTTKINFPVLPVTPNRIHTTNYSSQTPSIANEIARACASNKLALNTPIMPSLPKISLPNLPMTPSFKSISRKTPQRDWGTPGRLSVGRKSLYHATPNFKTPLKSNSKATPSTLHSATRSPRHSFPPDQHSSPFTQQLVTPYKTPTINSPRRPIQSPKFNHVFDMYKAEYEEEEEHNMPENQEGDLNFSGIDSFDVFSVILYLLKTNFKILISSMVLWKQLIIYL